MPSTTLSLLWSLLRALGTLVACGLILAAAVAAVVVINRTEPTAEKLGATRKSAALVETIIVERSTHQPKLVVLGTVTAAQDIVLSPRVSGQVVELSDSFEPGMTVQKGESLVTIDPADFQNAMKIRQSELEQAQASLEIEEGRRDLAEKELELLEGTIQAVNQNLVLRVPQINSIRAEIKAAEAALEQAKLDLERTQIVAPFDAQILRRRANIGSQVSPGQELARLVGIEEYWITAAVPVRSLQWMQFETSDGQGSAVKIRNPGTWPDGAERQATVARMLGFLDAQTRLAQVLISVPDPLATQSNAPPLLIDTLVETEIEGRPIEDVVRLSREYVRDRDTVWVMKDGKLEIREPKIVFRDATYAYIRDGLESGDEVITTTLATVAEGIGLKKVDAAVEADMPAADPSTSDAVNVPGDVSSSASIGKTSSELSDSAADATTTTVPSLPSPATTNAPVAPSADQLGSGP